MRKDDKNVVASPQIHGLPQARGLTRRTSSLVLVKERASGVLHAFESSCTRETEAQHVPVRKSRLKTANVHAREKAC